MVSGLPVDNAQESWHGPCSSFLFPLERPQPSWVPRKAVVVARKSSVCLPTVLELLRAGFARMRLKN